jgi:Phage Terminase
MHRLAVGGAAAIRSTLCHPGRIPGESSRWNLPQQCVQRCRRLAVHRRRRMAVGVERDRDGGVAEHLRDELRMDTLAEHQRRARMSSVMRSDHRDVGPLEQSVPARVDGRDGERPSVWTREDEPIESDDIRPSAAGGRARLACVRRRGGNDHPRLLHKRWQVRAVVCDPSWWMQTMETLASEGLPMVEFRPSSSRMVGASERFYQAIADGHLTHSGDIRLTRHIANAVLRMTPSGPRVVKETKMSGRHIDLAVAAILALDQAAMAAPGPEVLIAWG